MSDRSSEAGSPSSSTAAFDSVLAILAFGCAVALFVALAHVVPGFEKEIEAAKQAPDFLPELRGAIQPEPRERMLFQLGLLVGAFAPFGFYFVFSKLLSGARARFPSSFAVPSGVLIVALGLWLRALVASSEMPKPLLSCVATAGAVLPLVLASRLRIPRWRTLRWGFLAVIAAIVFRLMYCTEDMILADRAIGHHIDLLFGAINQVSHGRTILVDTTSQYGTIYPYVVALFVWPFGLSVTSVVVAFATLSVVALAFLYLVIRRAARAFDDTPLPEILFLGMLGTIVSFCLAAIFETGWIYYQFFPIRVVFGCVFFWYVGTYARAEAGKRKTRLLAIGYALAGVALLWNTDSGMVIIVAWTATALFDALARNEQSLGSIVRTLVVHGGAALATVLGALVAYVLFALVRSGHVVHLGEYLRFQKAFYAVGFNMLPMNPWDFWQLMLAVPFVTIFACLRRWWLGTADELCTEKLFIALYGLGIFPFYQGRSHVYVMVVVAYPAALLGCLHLIDLLKRPAGAHEHLLRVLAAFMPAAGFVVLASSIPRMIHVAQHPVTEPKKEALFHALDAVRDRSRGTELPVMSTLENYIHLKTETWSPFPLSSLSEVMLFHDVDQLRAVIAEKKLTSALAYPLEPPVAHHLPLTPKTPEEWTGAPP